MASSLGIAAAAASIEQLLNAAFNEEQPLPTRPTTAILVQTEDFPETQTERNQLPANGLTIFVYRVDFNKAMRAAWSGVGSRDGRTHLPLDLHFLITPWSENATNELRILGRAMECLENTPILSGPLLSGPGDWAPNESLQIVLEDVSTEAVMRMFDSLPGHYKLSVPYIGRVLRVDGRVSFPPASVTTVVTGLTPDLSG
jgi:hypothetical protein